MQLTKNIIATILNCLKKIMSAKHTIRLIAVIASVAIGTSAIAAEFTMGNYDRSGSRSIPGSAGLTKKKVQKHGLEVKWTAATVGSVAHSAVTSGNKVIVGDMNGIMYAFDVNDGSEIWQTCVEASCAGNGFPFAGIIGNPVVKGDKVYVGTLSGSLVALDIGTGAIVWTHTPLVNPRTVFGFLPLDAVWGGAIVVNDMVSRDAIF